MPTCSSTRFPTTRWSTSPKTSRRLDFTLLKRSLTKHSSGLYLLPRPVQLEDAALDHARRLAPRDRPAQGHVHAFDHRSFEGLQRRSTWWRWRWPTIVLLVTQLDLPCLRNVVRLMMSFERDRRVQGQGEDRRQPRGPGHGQISLKKAQETIGREIFWQLPNDYRAMVEVRNNGVPLIEQAPKAAITQSIVELADHSGRRKRTNRPTKRPGAKNRGAVQILLGPKQ